MIDQTINEFNWSKYENWNGSTLKRNQKITGQDNDTKVFSHESYAQELFNLYNKPGNKFVRKDLSKGDLVSIVGIKPISDDGKMMIQILGGLDVEIDLSREKKFLQLFNYSLKDFIQSLKIKENEENFIEQGHFAYVTESSPNIKISLWQGYLRKIRDEFMEEISSPSKAYVAKVKEANRGGFFVEVQGVDAFMPGSLAAPNKIRDFQSYIGREVIIMIEDYLKEMGSFIVSHKKYIEHVLPIKIKELSFNDKYEGKVTGASKYGIFVEFGGMFTGLLHKSKMTDETKAKFFAREYLAGDSIEFYIGEITKDNRIILTEESPIEKKAKIEAFLAKYKDKAFEATVVANMPFGIIVNCEGTSGIVPNKEFKKVKFSPNNFIVGDKMSLDLLELKDDGKLIFTFWTEEK